MGDNIPDFSKMTEEEQLRWLESLAARQGANSAEFMTQADMEVPEIDPDSVVIDEPGYVPSETFSFSKHAQPAPPKADTVASTEPVPSYQSPPPAPATSQADMALSMEELASLDPMAFLESLAARQGADPSQFVSGANVEVPEIDPNSVVIDEPGYVPSETFSFSQHAQTPPPPQATDESTHQVPAYDYQTELQPEYAVNESQEWYQPQDEVSDWSQVVVDAVQEEVPQQRETGSSQADIALSMEELASLDPMAFLQSLAARQGADPSQFVPGSMIEVPEIDPNSVVIDEPGYVPSETFSFSQHAQTPPSPPPENLPDFPVEEIQQEYDPNVYGQQYDPAAYDPNVYGQGTYEQQFYDPSAYPQQEYDPNAYGQQYDPAAYDPNAYGQGTYEQQFYDPSAYPQQEYDPNAYGQQYDPATYDPNAYGQGTYEQQFYDPSAYPQQEYDPNAYGQQFDPAAYDPNAYGQVNYEQETYDPSAYPQADFSANVDEFVGDNLGIDAFSSDEAAPLVDHELMADVDPMKWLESLARRQGVSSEELITDADLSVPEIDPNTADMSNFGPGYTPYSPHQTTPGQSYQAAEPPPADIPAWETAESVDGAEELGSPLAWLQDLASDQGSTPTDFLDELNTGILPDFDLDFDASGEEAASTLAAIIEPSQNDDFLSGFSDADIARLQAEGSISPEQELAWLMQKAERMGEILQDDEEILPTGSGEEIILPGDIPDWLQSQMPDASQMETEASELYPAFVDSVILPPEPDGVDDWLSQQLPQGAIELDLPSELVLEDTRQATDNANDLLAGYSQSQDPWVMAFDEETRIEQSGEPEWYAEAIAQVEDEPDTHAFAEGLGTEIYQASEVAGTLDDADMPDWLAATHEPIPQSVLTEDDTDLPEWLRISNPESSVSGDISEWLRDQQTGVDSDWGVAGAGDWLNTSPDEAAASSSSSASRATQLAQDESLAQGIDGALPPWYRGQASPVAATVPQTPPVSAPPPPPAAPRTPPVAAQPVNVVLPQVAAAPSTPARVPDDAQFSSFRSRLDENPDDHETRLKLARELNKYGNVNASMEQYETLIENTSMLEVIITDLSAVAARGAVHPKVRRLLGDTYMRQGRLQEALDTYRGALNQL